jgi:hypothetical protein
MRAVTKHGKFVGEGFSPKGERRKVSRRWKYHMKVEITWIA